jgi:hypothetical protein
METTTKILENLFIGTGEVKNMRFLQLYASKKVYMYLVGYQPAHYEVFERKNAPMCIDFENMIYSETEMKEYYPKSKDFGVWAWTFTNKDKALKKFKELSGQTQN